jgi:septum formation protein
MLLQLRGKTHQLHSAVVLAAAGEMLWSHLDTAELTMREFSTSFLDTYLLRAGARICNSVGGYELEGLGIQLFARIAGDYFTILGLPLLPLLAELRARGILMR